MNKKDLYHGLNNMRSELASKYTNVNQKIGFIAGVNRSMEYVKNNVDDFETDFEILTPEWIKEHQEYGGSYQIEDGKYYIPVEDVRKLIVPKRDKETNVNDLAYFISEVQKADLNVSEKPFVPQFVADHIEYCKKGNFSLLDNTRQAINHNWINEELNEFILGHFELFTKAWLEYPNIEIEEEVRVPILLFNSDEGYLKYDTKLYSYTVGSLNDANGWYKVRFTEEEVGSRLFNACGVVEDEH